MTACTEFHGVYVNSTVPLSASIVRSLRLFESEMTVDEWPFSSVRVIVRPSYTVVCVELSGCVMLVSRHAAS